MSFSYTAALSERKLGAKGLRVLGSPHNHFVIMRDMRTRDVTSRGIHRGQNRLEVLAIDVVQWMLLVASKSSKVLVDGFKILGPFFWIHDWQGDGVFMERLHLGLRQ